MGFNSGFKGLST